MTFLQPITEASFANYTLEQAQCSLIWPILLTAADIDHFVDRYEKLHIAFQHLGSSVESTDCYSERLGQPTVTKVYFINPTSPRARCFTLSCPPLYYMFLPQFYSPAITLDTTRSMICA